MRRRPHRSALALGACVGFALTAAGCGGSKTNTVVQEIRTVNAPGTASTPASTSTQSAATTQTAASTTPSTTGTSATGQTLPASGSGTQRIVYSPFAEGGKPIPDVTQTVSGSCQGSLVVGRASAWRCFLSGSQTVNGGNILDPCFSEPSGGDLYCVEDPADRTAVRLHPTGPLTDGNSSATTDTSQAPWAIVLSSGIDCTFLQGAGGGAIDGKHQSYGCSDGSTLYGRPSRSTATWTIPAAPKGSRRLQPQQIRTAYF